MNGIITGDYEIVVSGLIRSLGSRESTVVFKPAEDNSSSWGGFFFEDSIGGSEFRWTRIQGPTSNAVHLVRSYPVFDHVTFEGNSATNGGAIYIDGSSRILRSAFAENEARAYCLISVEGLALTSDAS